MPANLRVLPRDADAGVPHDEHQEARLTLGEAVLDDGLDALRGAIAIARQRDDVIAQLLGQAASTASAAAAAPPLMRRLRPAVGGEARARHAGAVRAAIVRRDDLDVLALPAAIRLLVLDAQVREMDLVVEVRQVVFGGPLANLIRRAIRVAVVVVVVLVALVEPALVLALQLVVEDDALDVGAALEETRPRPVRRRDRPGGRAPVRATRTRPA